MERCTWICTYLQYRHVSFSDSNAYMTHVIYVNWYLHMLRSVMIIHTYFHLYNSIEIMISKLMFIITFFIITGTKLHTLKD